MLQFYSYKDSMGFIHVLFTSESLHYIWKVSHARSDVQRTFLSASTATHGWVWQLSIFLILQRCCRRRFQLWRMNVWAGPGPAGRRISFQTSHDWACPPLPPFPAPVSLTRYTWRPLSPHGKNVQLPLTAAVEIRRDYSGESLIKWYDKEFFSKK